MSDPLKANDPPEDVLPYAPTWARNPGYRATQPGASYDAFSEEENPSYRSMAQMFAPQPERARTKKNSGMLLRFGAVIGVAGAALALFIGYVATRGGAEPETANAERFESVTNAVSAIQAALTPGPSAAPKPGKPAQAETSATSIEAPAPPKTPDRPVEAKIAANADTTLSTNRGAAPEAPPQVDSNLVPEPQPAAATVAPPEAPQVAALPPKEETPAPAPERIAPQLTAGELATLMSKGRRFIESGDFSSARPVYRRAAEAGYAEAALALGETYDPVTLEERGVVGMNGDVKQARHWYERAKELGSLEAPTRLERLPRD